MKNKSSFSKRLILTVISLATLTFMGIFSETSLAIVFPELMAEFNVSPSSVQWLTSGFLLILAVAIPLSPFLVKTFPTKRLFQFAVVIFITGTIIGAFAQSFEVLLAGRLIMAAGTGCSLPLLTNIVLEEAEPAMRGSLLGIAGMVVSFSPVLGPVLGGIIAEYLNWRWVFLFMIPFLLAAAVTGSFSIKDIRKNEVYKLNKSSFLVSSAGLILFIYGLSILENIKMGTFVIILSFVILAVFIIMQLKSEYPLINARILKYKMFTLGLLTVCFPMFNVLALAFLLPVFAQNGLGLSPYKASLLMFPGVAVAGILSPIMGNLYGKYGIKLFAVTGFILMTLALLFVLKADLYAAAIVAGYLIFMTGASILQVPCQTNTLNALPQEYNADGTAILSTLQQTAGASGTAVASVILSYAVKGQTGYEVYKNGAVYTFIFCLVLTITGLFIALKLQTTLKNKIKHTDI